MSTRVIFTPAAIDALAEGRLLDPSTPGLSIEPGARNSKIWRYRRKVPGAESAFKRTLGRFPKVNISDARALAKELNEQIESGCDPRVIEAEEASRVKYTVAHCHTLYMEAVRLNQHRTKRTRTAKPLKPRTISEKLELYAHDVDGLIGHMHIEAVTEKDVDGIIHAINRRGAEVTANRVGAELRVFFGWACSRRGEAAGINMKSNPSRHRADRREPVQIGRCGFEISADPDSLGIPSSIWPSSANTL